MGGRRDRGTEGQAEARTCAALRRPRAFRPDFSHAPRPVGTQRARLSAHTRIGLLAFWCFTDTAPTQWWTETNEAKGSRDRLPQWPSGSWATPVGLCACCGLGQPPTQEPLLPPVQPGVDPPVRRPLWVQPSLLLSLRCSVWTAALPWVHLLITYSLNKHKCCGPAPSLVPEAEMEAILSSGTLGLCAQPRL